jgi:curli biogenesis system outer membrane secretion channel CsgG
MPSLSSRVILPVAAAFISVCLPSAFAQGRRIAIYDFEAKTATQSLYGKVPQALNIGHEAASLMMTRLVNSSNHFEVIERADIERILKEQGRKFDERFDPASAPELGRLLNVDGLVLGEVVSASVAVSDSNMRIPGTKTSFGGRSIKAKVHISARLISTQSGAIQVAQEADGDANESVNSNVGNLGRGNSSDQQSASSNAVTKAMGKAVSNLSNAVIARAATLPQVQHPGAPLTPAPGTPTTARAAEKVPIVNSVDGGKVYVEGGAEFKINPGDRYDVRQVTKVLKLSNGDTTEVRERVETLVIDDVQGSLSIAHVEGGQPSHAKPGDQLQKSTSMPAILQGPPPAGPPPKSPVPVKKFLPGGGIPRGPQ